MPSFLPDTSCNERLIKTVGCYAGLFDIVSPANAANCFDDFMQQAKAQAETAKQGWATLFYFNDCWIAAAARGEILCWTLLFDGVFKVAVEILPSQSSLAIDERQDAAFLGEQVSPLVCPSGRLVVASLSDLGQLNLDPIVVVEPGVYRVHLTIDSSQTSRHEFLEDLSDYPSSDGPDWHIRLQRAGENQG